MLLEPGSRLDAYEVIRLLGAGGMGEVYRAKDSRLHRDVAIKVMQAGCAASPDHLRRFRHEALAIAALNHPNILVVYDTGQAGGAPYVVTELLDGETLGDRLTKGALPPARQLIAPFKSPTDWRRRTPKGSFIGISSRITCSSRETNASRFSTSGSPS